MKNARRQHRRKRRRRATRGTKRPATSRKRATGVSRRMRRTAESLGAASRLKRESIPISQLPKRSHAARDRALHVLAAMRDRNTLSLSHAAKLEGVKPETVKKYIPSALKKSHGKFRATKSDRYTAVLYVPDAQGNPVAVKTKSSKDREALGQYLRDLGRNLRGDRSALSRWRGMKIAGVALVTDERAIVGMEPALSDFSLYRAFNGGIG